MTKRRIFFLLPSIAFVFFLSFQHVSLTRAQDPFINPALPAPSGTTEPFIDTSSTPQTKAGSLILDKIGTEKTTLCLGGPADGSNPDCPPDAEGDTNELIVNGKAITMLGVPPASIGTEQFLPNGDDSSYAKLSQGFASLVGQAGNLYALGGAGNGSGGDFTWVAGLVGETGPQNPVFPDTPRYGVFGHATVNRDDAYAVYGEDIYFVTTPVPSTAWAAKFEGKTGINGLVSIGDATKKTQLCLNGQGSGDCLTSWDPEGSGFEFVNLQQNGSTITPQYGSVNLLGNANMQSFVAAPMELVTGSLEGIPVSLTCGDGACNNNETAGIGPNQCTADCS